MSPTISWSPSVWTFPVNLAAKPLGSLQMPCTPIPVVLVPIMPVPVVLVPLTPVPHVTLAGGDCAEQFDTHGATSPEPGTIMVIDDGGKLRMSHGAYDKRVAGVVSGAGEYRPAIVLDRRASSEGRVSVALVGKFYCKVDADPASVTVSDLLTTSERPGFAMKATDTAQAFGAVIWKALKPLGTGQDMIPILVALQ